ncbi:c-type cytochrome [Ketogulonicigenium vulgare]|uniref:c-type cytochrome n=1 Tax=Ketogulonicigenium vulgare TaxID=92945 RepID=UPI00235A3B91|nr:cytochrome c [Ketogulonicigenium vulgare]
MKIRYLLAGAYLGLGAVGAYAQDFDAAVVTRGSELAAENSCTGCHRADLTGTNMGWYFAPDISPNPNTLIGQLSIEEIVAYLQTGAAGGAVAAGPMVGVIENNTQHMSVEDLTAIATFLKASPASDYTPGEPPVMDEATQTRAALSYEVNCAACHGLSGEGIPGMIPAFAGNPSMLTNDATNVIHALLMGARAPATESLATAAGMPSFAWKMSDAEIVEILDFVRNSWGNSAAAVSIDEVEVLREDLEAAQKIVSTQ